ncbi:hypothetical protein F7725_012112 [Dissostichus mawsoni]|uniref:Uncharacterized protein n=1 Tax=Dissostichus mawsoni TaxID=36200 RepID=A0A7J5ZCP1_DISMA|nr:hypothetical protein F7725_012112 [Dissostichus mawsoni]
MLTGHFAAPQNVILQRIVFRQRWQQAGESVHHYVAIILMLHAPLQAVVSLEDLRLASEEDPTLSRLHTYIREGWPAKFPVELASCHRVKDELTCWNWIGYGPGGRHANSRTVPERQAQRRMKQRLDKRRRVPPFTVGDWVRIHRPNRDHKLLSFWTVQDTWKTIL